MRPVLDDLVASGPRFFALMLTTRCNLACRYCYQAGAEKASMSRPVLDAALELLLRTDHGQPTLSFFGGEPLLELSLIRHAVEVVWARKPTWMRPRFRVSTNGLLLDRSTAAFLEQAEVIVSLSMDGVAAAQAERGEGTFALLDGVLCRLRRENPTLFASLSVAVTLTSGNVSYLAASFRYFVSRGVPDVTIAPILTSDPSWDPRSRDTLDGQLAIVADDSARLWAETGDVPFRTFRELPSRSRGNYFCGAANRKEIFVDVDGTIAPCAAMAPSCLRRAPPQLRETVHALGGVNILDENLDEKLWDRERKAASLSFFRLESRRLFSANSCRECPASASCFVCPVSVAGTVRGPVDTGHIPAIACDLYRLLNAHRSRFLEVSCTQVPDVS